MKKQLLLSALALVSMSGIAQTIYDGSMQIDNAYIQVLSSNGKYCVSAIQGLMVIHDLETDESWVYEPMNESQEYSFGNGNCISRTGVLVGSEEANGTASYWEKGEWHRLPLVDENGVNLANGVSSNGNIIVGSINVNDENSISVVPAVWFRGEDGTFGQPTVLPYPKEDLFGLSPQYVLGISISDDGLTVTGQVIDNSGMVIRPLVYENVNGEWSYKYIDEDLLDKTVVLPPYPGDWDTEVNPKDYMTTEEYEQYQQDVADWRWDSGFDYPQPEDYMTDEQREAYEAAVAENEKNHEEWSIKYYEWLDAKERYIANLPSYEQNQAYISPDGTYFCANSTTGNPWTGEEVKVVPIRVNIKTLETKFMEERTDCAANQILSDGTIFCSTNAGAFSGLPGMAYVILPNNGMYIPINDYVAGFSEKTAQWMVDNMTQTYLDYVFDENGFPEEVEKTGLVTGAVNCSSDYRVFMACSPNYWDYESNNYYFSWLLTFPVERIILPETEIELAVANTTLLQPELRPFNATLGNDIEWRSSNPSVATVAGGLVTGIAEGEAEIEASCDGVSVSCTVKVVPAGDVVLVKEVKLSETTANVRVGEQLTLSASVAPENATNKTLIWSSSAPEIATVDQNGVVSGVAIGNTTITAVSTDGSNISAACEVSVSSGSAVEEVMVNGKIGSVYAVDGTLVASDIDAAGLNKLPAGLYIVVCDGLTEKYIKK